jgi:hypothetical protein
MNVRVAQLFSFNAGVWYDGALEMSDYTIKLWMITQTHNTEEQNIAICRVRHFMFEQIDNTIFVDSVDRAKCTELTRAGLNITSLPGEPGEQLIGIMLFHKLNAVMEERIKIVEIEISNSGGTIYLHGENETSEELIVPDWWITADLVHYDSQLLESDKIVTMHRASGWRDLDLAWPDSAEDTEHGNTVVFANFKSSDDTE